MQIKGLMEGKKRRGGRLWLLLSFSDSPLSLLTLTVLPFNFFKVKVQFIWNQIKEQSPSSTSIIPIVIQQIQEKASI